MAELAQRLVDAQVTASEDLTSLANSAHKLLEDYSQDRAQRIADANRALAELRELRGVLVDTREELRGVRSELAENREQLARSLEYMRKVRR